MDKIKSLTTEVTQERWNKAQLEELRVWVNEPQDGNDWNSWWSLHFDDYSFLKNFDITSIYEVGCGPYAKNIDIVINSLPKKPSRLILEDPLLYQYCQLGKSVRRFLNRQDSVLIPKSMESFSLNELGLDKVDLIICNNVLDHVQSVEKCFDHMYDSLNDGGIIVFGQDLTSDDDLKKHADVNDPCHPIKIDENVVRKFLSCYSQIYEKMLSRDEGRNPEFHYATILFAGKK